MSRLTDQHPKSSENGAEGWRSAALPATQSKGMPEMTDTALSALVLAWITTMIATTLFLAALAASQVGDSAVYFRALHSVLSAEV